MGCDYNEIPYVSFLLNNWGGGNGEGGWLNIHLPKRSGLFLDLFNTASVLLQVLFGKFNTNDRQNWYTPCESTAYLDKFEFSITFEHVCHC